jgi:hypothetical protein
VKQKLALVIDEISMLGARTLSDIDSRLQRIRSNKRPFGGIPIIIFSGDFFQFSPVKEPSVLLQPVQNEIINSTGRMTRAAKGLRGFQLFNECSKVIMLQQQVRASTCPQLRGFLDRFRKGQQTEADHEQLCTRANREEPWHLGSEDGKILTPVNEQRWALNLASALEWGKSKRKHISLFLSSHEWPDGSDGVSESEISRLLQHGDCSQTKIPSLLPVGMGMPMILTNNVYSFLKVVNGVEVEAVCL